MSDKNIVNKDVYTKFDFSKRLDDELKDIVFSQGHRESVIEKTVGAGKSVVREMSIKPSCFVKCPIRIVLMANRVRDFLNAEITIPVKPLVVGAFVVLSGLIYGCIGSAGVSAEEMQKSIIAVMEPDNGSGGLSSEIYKDQD